MKKQTNGFNLTAKCVNDGGYVGSIIVGKTYPAKRGKIGVLGIIDEEGEAYIYPEELFEISAND